MTVSAQVTRPNGSVITVSVTQGSGTWPDGTEARPDEGPELVTQRLDAWIAYWQTH